MKNKEVPTITNNEDDVRLRIYEGDLKIDEAGAELLRLEKAQRSSDKFWANERYNSLWKCYLELKEDRNELARRLGIDVLS